MRAISDFSKIMRVVYSKNCPNQTCDYWLITPNQQTLCINQGLGSSVWDGAICENSEQIYDVTIFCKRFHL